MSCRKSLAALNLCITAPCVNLKTIHIRVEDMNH